MTKYNYVEAEVPEEISIEIDEMANSTFNCLGVEEFSIDEARVDEILGDRSYSGGDLPLEVIEEVENILSSSVKKYFFKTEADSLAFAKHLRNSFQIKATVMSAENKDWNEEWKKTYKPILVSDKLEIVPSWEKDTYETKTENTVYIYPGMGFGTGGHETTFLCLKLFMDHCLTSPTEDVLDFGCGSGILGIVARLMNTGALIDLYDIDQEALDNSVQNIELNNVVKGGIELLLSIDRDKINKKYNIVFANILQNVLLQEKEYLVNSLSKGGFLILSGLLKGQEDEVISEYTGLNSKLRHVETLVKGDWVAVLMRSEK